MPRLRLSGPRRRQLARLARSGAGAALISITLAGCGVADASPAAGPVLPAGPPTAAAPAGCAVAAPITAAAYTRALASVPTSQWGGADLSISVPMPDGRSVWLYGDTLSGPTPTRWTRFVHSSAITQDHGCFHVSRAGAQILPNDSPTTISWLSAGIALDDTHLLVASTQVQLSGTCAFCFTPTGTRGAILTLSPTGDLTFASWLPHWPSMTQGIVWGIGMARAGNQVNLYGISGTGLLRDLYVATATPTNARTGHWTLGTTPIAHSVDPAGVTPYHDKDGWHVLTKRSDTILQLNSPSPAGPFTERALGIIHAAEPGHLYYMAAAHPELALTGNHLLITVCSAWTDSKNHPLPDYRPTYLELPR